MSQILVFLSQNMYDIAYWKFRFRKYNQHLCNFNIEITFITLLYVKRQTTTGDEYMNSPWIDERLVLFGFWYELITICMTFLKRLLLQTLLLPRKCNQLYIAIIEISSLKVWRSQRSFKPLMFFDIGTFIMHCTTP